MTLAQPVLIKRIDPDAAATPRTGLNLGARIALWTILAVSVCSLVRVVMSGDGSAQPISNTVHSNTAAEGRRTLLSQGGHAGKRKAAATPSRHPTVGESRNGPTPTSIHAVIRKGLTLPFKYQHAAGRLSLHLGFYGAAESYFTEAIEKYPQDVRARDERAEFYWRVGESPLAVNDFETALRIDVKDMTAMKGLAWLLSTAPAHAGHDQKRAIALAQQACILTGWRDSSAIEALAAAYAAAGAFDKAIKTQSQALALMQDTSRPVLRLARYAQHRVADSTTIPQL